MNLIRMGPTSTNGTDFFKTGPAFYERDRFFQDFLFI